ncbi:MAG: hypothetical protein E6I87_08805 [Chloroflexi bacterium]|nr:MAG: hypothetical protein E6I87_08805 [Chloroflexota bacterium]
MPVSGFCPRCLAALPMGRGVPWLVPLLLLAGLLVLAGALGTAMGVIRLPGLVAATATPPIARSLTPGPSASVAVTASATSLTATPSPSPVASAAPSASTAPSITPAVPAPTPSAAPVARIESVPATSTRDEPGADPAAEAALIVECVAKRGADAAGTCAELVLASEP